MADCANCSKYPCYNCSDCTKKITEESNRECALENSNLRAQVKELCAIMRFLHYDLENQSPGILEGDVTIIVQSDTDQPLPAHKFILASRSQVFRKIFETNMQEKETGILRIDDATLPVIRAVINFCYNAQIEFTKDVTSEEVLEVAHKYAINLLRRICEDNLTATISKDNLAWRLRLSRKFECTDLEAAASQFFKDNFDNVISGVLSDFC